MKVMCLYDKFAHDNSPRYGDVCTIAKLHYDPDMPDGIGAYSLEEHPLPEPCRFGAWRLSCKSGSLAPNFIHIEEEESVESEEYSDLMVIG